MSIASRSIRAKVDKLAIEVSAGRFRRSTRWAGAHVAISDMPRKPSDKNDFYPEMRYVMTVFAGELSWLFESLRDAFGSSIDLQNKLAFYGRLADAADRYLAASAKAPQTARGLLAAVTTEAALMAGEIK